MKDIFFTVVELPHYLKNAEKLLTPEQRAEVIEMLAGNPLQGVVIPASGGMRKFRYAATEGRGKSGGARIIYLAVTVDEIAYLVDIYAKSDKENVSKADLFAMAKIAKLLKGEGQ